MACSRVTITVEATDLSLPNDEYQSVTHPPIPFRFGCFLLLPHSGWRDAKYCAGVVTRGNHSRTPTPVPVAASRVDSALVRLRYCPVGRAT